MATLDDEIPRVPHDPVPRPAATAPDEDSALVDVRRHWRTVVRRRRLVAGIAGATFAVTLLANLPTRDLYVATTQIRIDPTAPAVLDVKDAAAPVVDQSYYQTEYAILDSPALASRVITALRLWDDRRFAPRGAADGASDAERARSLVRRYLEGLRVVPVQSSRLVAIEYASPSPELAAELSRAHARSFVRMTLESRTGVNGDAQRFLQKKLEELRRRMEASEAALNEFRRAHPELSVTSGPDGTLVVEGLKSLSASFAEAQAQRIALEADRQLVRAHDYGALAAVQRDPVYNALREQRETLRAEYARLSQIYRQKYPQMVELAGRIEELTGRMDTQAQTAVDAVESKYLAAKEKEEALAAALEHQRGAAIDADDATVQLQVLAREVNAHRQLYTSLLSRAKEIEIADSLHRTNVSIVSLADVPDAPSIDRFERNLLRGLLFGLCLGLLAAFGLESLDGTVKTPDDVESALRLPLLAVVPALAGHDVPDEGTGRSLVLDLAEARDPPGRAGALFLEAFRTLGTTVLLGASERPPQVIQVASAQGNAGKTLVTVHTGLALAQAGASVLVVDADLHRPRCHRLLGAARTPGLADALREAPLEQCVQSIALPETTAAGGRLDLLAVGGADTARPSALAGQNLAKILEAARGRYDHVLVDSPPLLAVADGLLIAAMADGVLLVIRNQATPRPVVKQAMARLARVGARVLGAVLNDVDLDAMRDYYGEPYPNPSASAGDAA